jgi:hypothetical protein
VTIRGAIDVQVGVRNYQGGIQVGQFFPVAQAGFTTIPKVEMQAIWDILRP